ncbi:MAG: tetratricopeptide repeat protein [Candidatus Marinimicrobia bacterium]|nr:tetratricopeptide repeat protein [Candidatus Neomarinimicrobiota bacterium]
MFIKQTKKLLFTGVISLIIWACGSSAEYTTAKMAIQDEEWDKAEEFLFKALEVEPTNAEVMVKIGYHVHAKKEQWVEMNEIFNKALSTDPAAKIDNRPISELVNNYRNMFWAENYNKAVRMYNEYKGSKDKSKLEDAINRFEQTVKIDPSEGQTYSILSTSYYELGDNEKALASAKKAKEIMPEDFQPNMTLGQILSFTGDKENAINYIKKAVEIDPTNSNAVRTLATLYYDLGDKEKSVETFEAAIRTETDKVLKANLYFNLGVLNMQLDNFQEAEDSFMFAYDLNPDDTEALVGIAQTFENSEKWRRASKFYRELIVIDPENPEHYKGMARVLIKQGDPEGATRYYEKAKKLGG